MLIGDTSRRKVLRYQQTARSILNRAASRPVHARHRGLARRLVAVRWVVPVGERRKTGCPAGATWTALAALRLIVALRLQLSQHRQNPESFSQMIGCSSAYGTA